MSFDSRRTFLALTALGGLGTVAGVAQAAGPGEAGAAGTGTGAASLAGAAGGTAPSARPAITAAEAGLVGDGVADDAPAIQAAYDAGVGGIQFEGGRNYLLDSPVFLDRGDTYDMFVLDLNGATLLLGGGLPATDAFWREPRVRWAFFPNTRRSAWNQGARAVQVDTSTRATGGNVGALISLTTRNGTVDGQGERVGFSFANRTGSRFDCVVLHRARVLHSWNDYSDCNVFILCHNRAGGPDDSVLVEQVSSGDGLFMASCKSDASVGVARLKYSRGAEIVGTVSGRIELDSCSGVRIGAAHQEAPIVNRTMIEIRNSDVVVDDCTMYLTRGDGPLPAAITIDDSDTDAHTELVLRDTREVRALESDDLALGALVSVDHPAEDTTVVARGLRSVTVVPGVGGVWTATAGPVVTGTDEIAAAVAAAPAALATGDWELGRRGGAWVVQPTSAAPAPALSRPTILAATGSSGEVSGGSLPIAEPLVYVIVARGRDGRSSSRSKLAPTIAGPARTVKLVLRVDSAPCELRIWRFRGTATGPDAYLSLPWSRPKGTLHDLGAHLSGFTWLTGGAIPR
ncbi:hypothetical protein ACDF64_06430 [Agromyces sp. MMS24-JH15]|uniref:hypothetical protein n=1 Tax=Agromyces sp. MMS24-JH15 TaxID=3243765 RepID=UPI003748368D